MLTGTFSKSEVDAQPLELLGGYTYTDPVYLQPEHNSSGTCQCPLSAILGAPGASLGLLGH